MKTADPAATAQTWEPAKHGHGLIEMPTPLLMLLAKHVVPGERVQKGCLSRADLAPGLRCPVSPKGFGAEALQLAQNSFFSTTLSPFTLFSLNVPFVL